MITRFILLAGSLGSCSAFLAPTSSVVDRVVQLQATRQNPDGNAAGARAAALDTPRHRRDFLMLSAAIASSASIFSKISNAEEEFVYKRDEAATDLTSQLFNPDGSLKDPNSVVVAQEKEVNIAFSVPLSPDSITVNLSTDGSSPSAASDSATKLKATYKLPTKWNQVATSTLPLYYDSSEGKNGKSCNRITIYSVSAPKNLDMSTLEKATKVGVAKSLFMGDISNGYFDQGVLKADLIGGRTARKPIQSSSVPEGIDEQVYYEFDLAFAPLSCPDFKEGNKENLGLGFCPYDDIFLVSATVLNADNNEGGTLVVCVVECNKDEWKIANGDLKRVRSSFIVDRA